MIIPNSGVPKATVINEILKFNTDRFAANNLAVSDMDFDTSRTIIKVDGITDSTDALQYLMAIIRNTSIYDPLANAEYRNFIISSENFDVFLRDKDINSYMDFYKEFYLNK